MINNIENDINKLVGTGNREFYLKLLQIVPGGYGEGDILLSIPVPSLKKIANKYFNISNSDLLYFLNSEYHEYRIFALQIMVIKAKTQLKEMYDLYLANIKYINNWDLVDLSCEKIIGRYLYDHLDDYNILFILKKMYQSDNLWQRRIAIVSTLYLIKNNKSDLCLEFFKDVVNDEISLNNKALGWMLRTIGKKDKVKMIKFIKENKLKNITFNYCMEICSFDEKTKLKKYLAILIIIFLFPLNVWGTSGAIKEENTLIKDNIIYGYHGSDNHCHTVLMTNGKYYAKDLVDNSYCRDILNDNSSSLEVTFKTCVDGDTATFIINNKEETVRFLAIDTEESVSRTKLNTYMGKVASNYTCNKLKKAKKITIEYDLASDKKDKYNRTLGWVYVDDTLLQKDLVENGYAKVAYLYGDYKYTNVLKESEETAKRKDLGVWDEDNLIANIYNFFQKILQIFT